MAGLFVLPPFILSLAINLVSYLCALEVNVLFQVCNILFGSKRFFYYLFIYLLLFSLFFLIFLLLSSFFRCDECLSF